MTAIMPTWFNRSCGVLVMLVFLCLGSGGSAHAAQNPTFRFNVSVHDPSVIKVDDLYYVFGSHLAAAKSKDLMNWSLVDTDVRNGNRLIPNVLDEMGEELAWVGSDTFWAPDVIQLADGRFYMFYCIGRLDAPRALTGLAVADEIEGPYTNQGVIVRSGMWNQKSPDGRIYDATIHPNAVDPHVFFDAEGQLWMVYGSYSGGIFIYALDPETGWPKPDQGYGKRLLGGNHSRMEGPYILYSPHTKYYYLFVTFGGLAADGAYNIRVMRSRTPDGPYFDASGNPMLEVMGKRGTVFDDRSIEPFGVKLMGNHVFLPASGKPRRVTGGYVSPGHNSAYYDPEDDTYFLIFHTRFENQGEFHEVRVHQMLFNEAGWPVIAPHRYAGEAIASYATDELLGDYRMINHGKEITTEIKKSELITLHQDGQITGAVQGKWQRSGDWYVDFYIDGTVYQGIFLRQWDAPQQAWVMTFSALSKDGVALWGSKLGGE